ncbi:phage tail protein [Niveispirillum sp. SYP-B3756]|uniref:phage tail sheath subtilisin-like domain-containing protein n=1 Tax=Niveispirillum sp. SYP-B3756 TaxID=2662178 RepID=UPI001291F4FE|nr:phage tail sheath subtilisin-like domain-containing protein [Niveispirillum sp. SYP-B3756]MQP64707.1 phage tail protein [Niveispirillum sp. SYP-B3756]
MAFFHGIEITEVSDGIRPVETVRSAVIGVVGTAPGASAASFPLDTPVLLPGHPRLAADLGTTGTLPDAVEGIFSQAGAFVVVIRVAEGADTAATLANIIGSEVAGTGIHALPLAGSVTGVVPRILIAPGFTSARAGGTANPAAAALQGVAAKLRAVAVIDAPNTTDAAAITYAGDWGSARLFVVDPHVLVFDQATATNVPRPASPRVAGLMARVDGENGFWYSPSNHIINGIVGTDRPIEFNLSNPNNAANLLNEKRVAVIVRREGWRLWGNRTTSADAQWSFLPVRRTADMVYESLEAAMLWAMARPFSRQLLLDVQETVQTYINTLVTRGALLGGKVWIDPSLNSGVELMAGKLTVDLDLEPPAPLESLKIRAHRNNGYYQELVADMAA